MSKPLHKRTVGGLVTTPPVALWLKRASVGVGLVASMAMLPSNAMALALGRLNTLSHMGERLNVEIDIPELASGELQGLRASIAPPDLFQASGMEFSPSLVGADVSLQKRPDGRYFFRVSTPNAINDPFVNLVIVVNWPSGRIVRDYSLLLDPAEVGKAAPAVTATPTLANNTAVVSAPAPIAAVPAPVTASPKVTNNRPAAQKTTVARTDSSKIKSDTVNVVKGMTASEIALANRPEGISLDQMLVALLKANPQAFVDNNVNRMKAGVVLHLPGDQDASKTGKSEARQLISAQSHDFDQYKRQLAGIAPANGSTTTKRQSTGQVETKVTEKKPSSTAPDKLQLSTAAKDAKSKEAGIAKDLQAKEDAARLATLSKNIQDLNQLSVTTGAKATGAASGAGSSSKSSNSDLPSVGSTAASNVRSAEAVATASAPRMTSSAVSAPVVAEEPGILESLGDNPLLLPAGAGLIALLGGWAWYRQRQRKVEENNDSAFYESQLQTDSFFGVSGGQQIDTQETPPSTGGNYTASQLNAAADVDPIAEADVYLAYGRDMQAEEILKDAMAAHPGRLAIPLKLLEMYAKRSDNRAFDKLLAKVKLLTNSSGPEWERAKDLSKTLAIAKAPDVTVDPSVPSAPPLTAAPVASIDTKSSSPGLSQPGVSMHTGEGAKSVSYEMDLDFSSGVGGASVFEKSNANNLPSSTLSHINTATGGSPVTSTKLPAKPTGSPDIIDFDLSALSLDLNSAVPLHSPAPAVPASDPWATKLALAKEFQSIGDVDSARKMIQEVINGAGESVKAEAKKLLAGLA